MSTQFRVMGILNVTPDSFSDGGRYLERGAALARGLELAAQGAAIVDVGGESTRPGAEPVEAPQELARVVGVIEALVAAGLQSTISIDTTKAVVADAAVVAGARYVNDVSAFRNDPELAGLVADARIGCCLMHMRGEPRTMQHDPVYRDVVDDVRAFLEERMEFAIREGVREEQIMVDPGIGFGKTVEHNLTLLRRLSELRTLGRPIVIGTSRKSFLGRIGASDLLAATIATNVIAYERGAAVFRVHDVGPVHDALKVAAATVSEPWNANPTTLTS
jgi:dihydropteroate synthase